MRTLSPGARQASASRMTQSICSPVNWRRPVERAPLQGQSRRRTSEPSWMGTHGPLHPTLTTKSKRETASPVVGTEGRALR